jgi:hypothetical protein
LGFIKNLRFLFFARPPRELKYKALTGRKYLQGWGRGKQGRTGKRGYKGARIDF